MSDEPILTFTYEGDERRTRIVFDNGDSEELLVTPIGSGLYRLEESSFVGEIRYRDVIRAIELADRSLQFKEIVTTSELTTQSWIFSEEIMDSEELTRLLAEVMAIGGNWERAFGGVLIIHVPPESIEMISEQITRLTYRNLPRRALVNPPTARRYPTAHR